MHVRLFVSETGSHQAAPRGQRAASVFASYNRILTLSSHSHTQTHTQTHRYRHTQIHTHRHLHPHAHTHWPLLNRSWLQCMIGRLLRRERGVCTLPCGASTSNHQPRCTSQQRGVKRRGRVCVCPRVFVCMHSRTYSLTLMHTSTHAHALWVLAIAVGAGT